MFLLLTLAMIALSAAMLLSGCDHPAGTTPPATHAAATRPSALPTAADFNIDGKVLSFDAPRAMLDRDSTPPRLMIYSENENPAGSFYFEVPVDSASQAGDAIVWEQQLQQNELQDSLIGIQLKQANLTLQPQSLRIEIRPAREGLIDVVIAGQFLVYSGDAITTQSTCAASAQFRVAIAGDQ